MAEPWKNWKYLDGCPSVIVPSLRVCAEDLCARPSPGPGSADAILVCKQLEKGRTGNQKSMRGRGRERKHPEASGQNRGTRTASLERKRRKLRGHLERGDSLQLGVVV